ncbi:MAG: hypothetical protein ABI556_01310 [Gemmatimonadales bacterium]
MTEPSEGLPKTKVGETEITARSARSFEQLDSLNANRFDELPQAIHDSPERVPYKKERLFSRKVIIGWAAATLIVWFAITFIAPAVFETVKQEIVSRMQAPTSNTAIPAPVEPVAPVPAVEPVLAPVAEPASPAKPAPHAKPAPPAKAPATRK